MASQEDFETRVARAAGPVGKLAAGIQGMVSVMFIGFGLFAAANGVQQWTESGGGAGIALAIFGVVFALAGVALANGAKRARQRAADLSDQLERHAHEPWRLNEEWASGRIEGTGATAVVTLWAVTLVWCGLSLPAALAVPDELAKGNELILIALLFPAVGLGLIAWSGIVTARHRRHGRADLELASMPGVRGGELRVTLVTRKPLPPEARLRVTLRNLRRTTSGSGKNRRTSERALWEDTVEVAASSATMRHDGYGLPLALPVPYDTRSSDPVPSANCILWRLELGAELEGADFQATFDVPVFETPESDPDLTSSVLSRKRAETSLESGQHLEQASSIEMRPGPHGGLELHLPPARNKAAATTVTLIGAAFTGAAWLMHGHAPLLFPIVFGAGGLLALYGALFMWLGSVRTEVAPDGVHFTRRLLFFSRSRFYPREQITGVGIHGGMTSGSTTFWDVRLELAGAKVEGSGPRIAPNVRDRREAESILHRVEDALGLGHGTR